MTPPFSGPHPPPSEGKGVSIWAKPLTPPFDAVAPASRASVSSYRPPSASTQPIQSAPVWQPPAVSVSLSSPIPVQPSQPDLDNCDQRIVEDYEDYHRSVLLYTMAENVNGSAAIALEQHFNSQGINFRVPWVSHTTIGYICEGTPRTFIVLHNAFNPFAYDTKNTTTIGFFVASPYVFSEINWKTYDISMINFFKQCENGGMIQVTRAWNKSMPKAVDRKYHRAYWLAAGRKPLKALLNRAAPGYPKECEPIPESLQETDEDVFTGVGDDFEFEVPLTLWETEQKWNEILNHPCQRPDWKWDDSVEWMLTGSSEM
ncbi:hypothetical protein P154DRAFT_528242 [Amniculicola lignicola CBS 123094]|uniref:Uncharacterized protein n=1 Tax=Amniculicola lignicola CBS 123094 TaxID=1392246 RepID=A0A6A5VXZ6_9PLEO|nr:hypothetical protein P154DRAFT_528242 [Amniculicola lignicola CBS 123094]